MTDIVQIVEVWNPKTGEIVHGDDTQGVAEALAALREFKQRLDGSMRDATQILVEESRRQGTKTLRFDGVTAELRGGPQTTYDTEALRVALEALGCPQERLEALIRTVVTYRVDARVARQLAAANPEYAAAIEASKSMVEKPYWAKVAA